MNKESIDDKKFKNDGLERNASKNKDHAHTSNLISKLERRRRIEELDEERRLRVELSPF